MKITRFLVQLLLAVAVLLYGCKKDNTEDLSLSEKKTSILDTKKEMVKWIDLHVTSSKLESHSLDLVKENLIFEGTTYEKRKNGEDIIIIPVKKDFGSNLKVDQRSSLKLVTINKNGRYRWSMIVSFLPDIKNDDILQDKAIKSIVNNEPVEQDGSYKFFNLKGKLLFQLSYKNGKLKSYGSIRKKADAKVKGATMSNDRSISGVTPGDTYTDWYLVTTYYDENGNIESQTWEYVMTTCDDGSGGGGGGGGGGNGGDDNEPEDPVDVELTHTFEFRVSYTDFEDDDYHIPGGEVLIPEEVDPNDVLLQAPAPSPLDYICRVSVIYTAETRKILSTTALPVTVHPAIETYTHVSWGQVTRHITIIGANQNASAAGMTVSAYWTCSLHYMWSYLAYGTSRTKMVPFSYAATMTVP